MNINLKKLETAAEIIRAISHPIRLKILAFIDKNKEINVNKIYGSLRLEQSITSQHLKIMRDAHVVKTERKGKFIIYSVNYDAVNHYLSCIDTFLENLQTAKKEKPAAAKKKAAKA